MQEKKNNFPFEHVDLFPDSKPLKLQVKLHVWMLKAQDSRKVKIHDRSRSLSLHINVAIRFVCDAYVAEFTNKKENCQILPLIA